MLLRGVGSLGDDVPILANILDPELIQDEKIGMCEMLKGVAGSLGLRGRKTVRDKLQREPARECHLAQMPRPREEIGMAHVAGLKISQELAADHLVPDNIAKFRHGETW